MRLVRSGNGPIFRSTAPEWLEALLLRAALAARKVGDEDRDCIMFADRLREAALMGRLRCTFTHIPHEVGGGGKNAGLRYNLAKALGLISGSADFVFVWAGGGLWLEFKRARLSKTPTRAARAAGQLNPAQRQFRDWCGLVGAPYRVVYSATEALGVLQELGLYDPEPASRP